MSLNTSLGDILHITLGEEVKCFGLTKIPGKTRPCGHELGKQRLSQARLILVQSVAQLERHGDSIETSLDQLSQLLVQVRRHGEAGEARRKELVTEWRRLVLDFHRAQLDSITPTQALSQLESGADGSSSGIEALEEEIAAPGSSTQDDTPTPAALHSPAINHVTMSYSISMPDDLPVHSEITATQWRIGQEIGCREPISRSEVAEPLCDRSDLQTAYSSATRGTVFVDDVCLMYIWNLLFRFRFIFQALFCASSGNVSFESLMSLRLKIIKSGAVSTDIPVSCVLMIPCCYFLICLARLLLDCNVVLIIGGLFFATGWTGRNPGWWPIQPRN